MTKTCYRCGIEQDIEQFYLVRRGGTRRRSRCRACLLLYKRSRLGWKPRTRSYSLQGLPLGSIRLFNGKYYIKYRSCGSRKRQVWRAYEHWLWEKINGTIPKGYFVKHIDGDEFNVSLNNLCLTTFGKEESRRMKNEAYSAKKRANMSRAMQKGLLTGRILRNGFVWIRECSSCGYEDGKAERCPKCNCGSFITYKQKRAS